MKGIKGTLFSGVIDDVNLALSTGALSHEMLEASLEASDLELLESKLAASAWVDILAYRRIVEVLASTSSLENREYWFERGRRASRRLLEMNIYQQLDYLGRLESVQTSDPKARFEAFGRDMKLLISLQSSLINFGVWTCVPDPKHEGRYQIEIRDVDGVPDGIFVATSGFFTGFGDTMERTLHWAFERPDPDLALIRMLRRL